MQGEYEHHILALWFFYIPGTFFNSVRAKTYRSSLLKKKPHSVKQEVISTYSVYYCYIIMIVMHCIGVMFYVQNTLAVLQTR